MKQLHAVVLGILFALGGGLYNAPPCDAEDEALKRECETKAENAAELIRTLGDEAAFEKITDPVGPFVGKTSHVFCIDANSGVLLAHKVTRFVGSDMHYYTDADGNHPYAGILRDAGQKKRLDPLFDLWIRA